MTTGERIKELRGLLHLSQTAFGEKIGVRRDVIANIELERVAIKELMIKTICRTFAVNPLWLAKGEGEPFLETADAALDDLSVEYDLTAEEKDLVAGFLKMPREDRKKLTALLRELFSNR